MLPATESEGWSLRPSPGGEVIVPDGPGAGSSCGSSMAPSSEAEAGTAAAGAGPAED